MEIMLPQGEKIKLAKEFKVSSVTVWKALTGKTNSKTAITIRKAAMERGGKIYMHTPNEKLPADIAQFEQN